jgi:signal transduction histidine kinase
VKISSCQEEHDGKPCYGLIISDNGSGFDPGSIDEGGIGLVSMRERIEKLGGKLDIQTAPGKGTIIKTCVHPEESA